MMSPRPLLLWFMLLLSTPILSQDVDLRLRSSYGFDGIVKPGTWNPLYIGLTNLGDSVAGTLSLEVIVSPGAPNNETVLLLAEEIELGKGEGVTRRFALPVARGSLPLRLRLRDSGNLLLEEEILPPLRYTPETLVVALSSGALESLRGVTVAYPLLEHLPDAWHGYAPVDMIVLANPALERLSPSQWEAIEEWVRFGGKLLMLSGEPGPPATEALLTTLWEAGQAIPAGPQARPGPSNEEEAGVSSRRLGDGRLYRTPGLPAEGVGTLRDLLSRHPSEGHAPPLENSRRPFADGGVAALAGGGVYRYPSRRLMGLVLLAAALSLAFLTRQGEKAPRMTLLSPLLLPLAFATILALLFSTTAAPPANLALEVQRAQRRRTDTGSFELRREVLLMSSRARSYEVSLPRGSVLLANAGRQNRVELVGTGGLEVRGELEEWDRRFLATWERRFLDLSVELLPEEGAVRIENGEELLLRESALLTSWHTFSAGPVSPGQQVSRTLREDSEKDLSPEARRYVHELRKERELLGLLREGSLFVAWTSRITPAYDLDPPFEERVVRGIVIVPMEGAPPR
jgi:hypothetical protein